MIDILFLAHGRPEFTDASLKQLQSTIDPMLARVLVYKDEMNLGPVGIMAAYLQNDPSEIFVKLDSDTIVPPGWFERCMAVMNDNPDLDLLGIEPPSSTVKIQLTASDKGYTPTDSIGGIGVMRRRAFQGREPLKPHSTYGGFTDWQQRHPEVVKGWLTPPLSLFLLDRLPMEPWASFSKRYIAEGQQRPWKNYTEDDAHLWSWWNGAHEVAA